MAYANTNSSKRALYTRNTRGNSRSSEQPTYSHAQEQHIYEEQPYYSNERPTSRQNLSGDNRRSDGVCNLPSFAFISSSLF